MTWHLRNLPVLIVAVSCGVAIAASHYVVQPLDTRVSYDSLPLSLRLVYSISLLNVVPRIFIARIICEALGLPGWFGELLGALYWPALGVLAGTRQHWAAWGAGALAVNVALLALLLYALSRAKFTF
ncbi:MAG: hypothetical protein JOZ96_26325 [Acidobacteria bacterium]|nr:hypothetical protein [Acidobacteriota bacterium]